MAVAIGLRFPAGRYHATWWGKHVNQGTADWPPSPWRLLRALVSGWKQRMTEQEGEAIQGVIEKLLSLPHYSLPPASPGHSRHYMPLYHGSLTLVFDGFLALERNAELVAVWPDAELTAGERSSLSVLLARLNYLGRSESWCEARLLDPADAVLVKPNCGPVGEGNGHGEAVRLLAACADAVDCARRVEEWPLCAETGDLRQGRWSDPPGSRWVTYMRPRNCFEPLEGLRRHVARPMVEAVRYGLDGSVLPQGTEALSVGEIARHFLQGIFGRQNGGASSELLSGKTADGRPIEGHRHAFYLSTDEDMDGRIDHLTVYAPAGFAEAEVRALESCSRIRQVGGRPDLNVLLTGLGRVADFRGLGLFGPSRTWRSATPFVAVRHTKVRKGVPLETAADQLFLELERRGYPRPVRVEPLERCPLADGRSLRWIEFRRERLSGAGLRGGAGGYGYEIEFAEAVTGPIALGYACHFGLGQFQAVGE